MVAKLPPVTVSCPKCQGAIDLDNDVCSACNLGVKLQFGCLADGRVVPPPFESFEVKVKNAGFVTRTQSIAGRMGIRSGDLDPVMGMVPMDERNIPWNDIFTVTTWKTINWRMLIATLLLLAPLSLLFFAVSITTPGFLIAAVPSALVTAAFVRKSLTTGARHMRVCGGRLMFKFRYDTYFSRWKQFEDETRRRSGIAALLPPPA